LRALAFLRGISRKQLTVSQAALFDTVWFLHKPRQHCDPPDLLLPKLGASSVVDRL
jgi:hypothetical protein